MLTSYADPDRRRAIFDLLDTSFDRLSERIRIADALGAPWHAHSTPFVRFVGDIAVTHVGVMAVPVRVEGRQAVIGGIHAVCTRPECRRRGHFREVMDEALEHCDARYAATWLFTSRPQLYEPFGFRVVAEHVFSTAAHTTDATAPPFERLRADRKDHVDLLRRLLAARTPVSHVLAVTDPGWLFLMNEAFDSRGLARLHCAADLDVVVAYEVRGSELHVLDIAGLRIPPLLEMLERISGRFDRVVLHFVPDRLDGSSWEPRPSAARDLLMVRGTIPVADRPLCVPPLGRC